MSSLPESSVPAPASMGRRLIFLIGSPRSGSYALERKVVVALRRNIHNNALGRLVRRVREACDVLLR